MAFVTLMLRVFEQLPQLAARIAPPMILELVGLRPEASERRHSHDAGPAPASTTRPSSAIASSSSSPDVRASHPLVTASNAPSRNGRRVRSPTTGFAPVVPLRMERRIERIVDPEDAVPLLLEAPGKLPEPDRRVEDSRPRAEASPSRA